MQVNEAAHANAWRLKRVFGIFIPMCGLGGAQSVYRQEAGREVGKGSSQIAYVKEIKIASYRHWQ